MCDYFQCPAEQVRYVDPQAEVATGALAGGPPLLRYDPGRGRHCLDVEIGLRGGPEEEPYPVWVHLEFVPLRRGGIEFHFGRARFQLPDKEGAFFDHVAEAITQELREGYTPGPQKVGY
jgi:hypothetical protein